MKDTLAIVGSHTGTRSDVDWGRDDLDIWVFNEALSKALTTDANDADKWCERADAVFQMHDPAVWKNPLNRNDRTHADWLKSGNTPVIYMLEAFAEVPQAVKFPLDEVIANTGGLCTKFITSSVALAFALAIYQGYKKIEVYGVEMETETEYVYQRDAMGYWFGVMDGIGIELKAYCNFLKERYVYGYEGKVTVDLQDFHDKIVELEPARKKAWHDYTKATNEYNAYLEEHKALLDPDVLVSMAKGVGKLMSIAGSVNGSIQVNSDFINKAAKMKEASGEYLFVRQEFEQGYQAMMKQHQRYSAQMMAQSGKCDQAIETVKSTGNKGKKINRIHLFNQEFARFLDLAQQTGMFYGGANENQWYAKKLDKLVRAAGGTKSEQAILYASGKDGASAENELSQGVTEKAVE